jgi:hypothetical protein
VDLDEISMPPLHIFMRPTRRRSYAQAMPGDIVAILLGLLSFAVLYLIIEAIDRV